MSTKITLQVAGTPVVFTAYNIAFEGPEHRKKAPLAEDMGFDWNADIPEVDALITEYEVLTEDFCNRLGEALAAHVREAWYEAEEDAAADRYYERLDMEG